MSALVELTKVLIPPAIPVGSGSPEEWDAVEASLGWRFPRDYKSFISTYGFGVIDEIVWIFSPFVNSASSLQSRLAEHREAHAVVVEYEYEPEGLVPWASNTYRGMCYWETDNPDPDAWTIYAALDDDVHRFPEDMTTFLLRTLKGEHLSSVFGGSSHQFKLPVTYRPQP